MMEEIEVLEHHTHLLTDLVDVGLRIKDILVINVYLATGRRIQQVKASHECTFSCTGRTYDGNDLSLGNSSVHILEYMERTICFL